MINEPEKPISTKQMSSIHIYYRHVAVKLNNSQYDIQRAIATGAISLSIPFTESNVKEIFGRAVIRSLYPEKDSHTRLSTTETQMVYEVLNAAIAERFGFSVPWPDRYSQSLGE
jgi:hypothetical protein